MKTTDFITEHNAFIAQDASEMHTDHEVQMARADCYHAADYAIKLHKILAQVGEGGNLEGWVSEKITLANDYLRTVYEYLSYEEQEVDLHAMPVFAMESAEAQLQAELNEVNPHNYDSDEDYYAAQNAPAKPRYRGTSSPGVNPDDEAYFREIFRKKRLAAQQAEREQDHDRLATGTNEGQLNEYLVKAGMPVKDVLALNLFQDFDPVEGAAAQFEEFAQDPMWKQVVRKYAPIANMLKKKLLAQKRPLTDAEAEAVEQTWYDGSDAYDDVEIEYLVDIYNQQIDTLEALLAGNLTDEEFSEGVAETMTMDDAVKVLRHYGADNFKTTSNSLNFYKNGQPLSVDLIWNDDATRSVSLSSLNSVTRQLKGQGVAEGSDIGYHQTSGTKAGYTVSSRKLSNKPQASNSDVTLQSGSMNNRGKSYNFPKGTLFTQLPGGIFAKHPSVPETHPGYGHLIKSSEDNINQIHNALNNEQGVAEGSRTPQDWEVKSAVWGLDKRGVYQEPQNIKSHFVRADRSSRAEEKAKREYEPGRGTWEIHPRGNKEQDVAEAAKGIPHRVRYQYDDPSGAGIASGHITLHAPDKAAAARYAASDLSKKGKKNVKVLAVTPQKQGVAEGSVSHAELAKLAHDAYVQATRKGNGAMAAHYLKQHAKHKADAAKDKGKQTVSEMTAGGTGAGGFATGAAGGTGKPGTGVPKRVKNVVKRLSPKIGTGIYK